MWCTSLLNMYEVSGRNRVERTAEEIKRAFSSPSDLEGARVWQHPPCPKHSWSCLVTFKLGLLWNEFGKGRVHLMLKRPASFSQSMHNFVESKLAIKTAKVYLLLLKNTIAQAQDSTSLEGPRHFKPKAVARLTKVQKYRNVVLKKGSTTRPNPSDSNLTCVMFCFTRGLSLTAQGWQRERFERARTPRGSAAKVWLSGWRAKALATSSRSNGKETQHRRPVNCNRVSVLRGSHMRSTWIKLAGGDCQKRKSSPGATEK